MHMQIKSTGRLSHHTTASYRAAMLAICLVGSCVWLHTHAVWSGNACLSVRGMCEETALAGMNVMGMTQSDRAIAAMRPSHCC